MSRPRRIHIPGGTYYVTRPIDSESKGCLQPEDFTSFEMLLPSALIRTGTRLLGYCWMPDAMHLALQISHAPVGNLLRDLTGHFAQRMHHRTGERGPYFRSRYQAMLIDPQEFLVKLIHHLHYLPVSAGFARSAADYLWSSHQAYLGALSCPWLDMKPLLHRMGGGKKGRITYREMLAEVPPADVTQLFARRGRSIPAVLGNDAFVASLSRPRTFGSKLSLQQISDCIAQAHGVSIADLKSRSRSHELVVARAQISWFAIERRIATLNQTAGFLNHSASSLTRAITRCRRRHPELFILETLRAQMPWNALGEGSSDFRKATERVDRPTYQTNKTHSRSPQSAMSRPRYSFDASLSTQPKMGGPATGSS